MYKFKLKKEVKSLSPMEMLINETVDKVAREKFYDKLNELAEKDTLDEFLKEEDVIKYINPTYTSGGSKQQMILRKMKNNALKYYPKEYDNTYVAEAVKEMFEDRDDSLNEKPGNVIDADAVEKFEKEISEPVNEEAPKDFTVNDDGVVEEPEMVMEYPPNNQPAPDNYEQEF